MFLRVLLAVAAADIAALQAGHFALCDAHRLLAQHGHCHAKLTFQSGCRSACHHASWTHMCPWCLANTVEHFDDLWACMYNVDPRPWNDWSSSAAWLGTIWRSATDWLNYHGGRLKIHPLFLLPGVSILSLIPDILHILNLGVEHDILGNVFWLVAYTDYFSLQRRRPRHGSTLSGPELFNNTAEGRPQINCLWAIFL